MIIYVYKTVIDLLPNSELEWSYNDKTRMNVKPLYCHSAPAWVKTV